MKEIKLLKVKRYSVILICVLSACNYIAGTYVANTPGGPDTLIISDNNKYTRICYPNAPEDMGHFTDTGSWNSNNGSIYFRDWIDRNGTIHGDDKTHIIYGMYIMHSFFFIGKIELPIDYDMDYYYKKIK